MAGHVSKIVKGLIIAMALVAVLDRDPDPGTTVLAIVAAIAAIVLGELYGRTLEEEIVGGRHLTANETVRLLRDLCFIGVGAAPAGALFVLAWVDVIDSETALDLSLWSGLAILVALGFVAGRRAGGSLGRSLAYAAALGLVGAVIVVIKTLA